MIWYWAWTWIGLLGGWTAWLFVWSHKLDVLRGDNLNRAVHLCEREVAVDRAREELQRRQVEFEQAKLHYKTAKKQRKLDAIPDIVELLSKREETQH